MRSFLIPTIIIIALAALVMVFPPMMKAESQIPQNAKEAIFAGGCFWCNEAAFEAEPGVIEAITGYTGGDEPNPTYEQVSAHLTGHRESVKVIYDPEKISYKRLVELFWRQIDPTDPDGQFYDKGHQYTTAIYYQTDEEKQIAEESKKDLEKSKRFKKSIVTEILPAKTFWPAEEQQQGFYKKHVLYYGAYKKGSGREIFKEEHWSDANSESDIKSKLTPMQYAVTQQCSTEPPFKNEYWNNHREGIYVDVVSGEPLFSSTDKFDSGTGWPSFTKPISKDEVVEQDDPDGSGRTEVKSKDANSHLGHVFDDGPNGQPRYCINSASLRFIPKEDLEKEGYGEYLKLFE